MENPPETATSELQATSESVSVEKTPSGPFAKVRPELSEDEFTTPAVSRMLLDRISDLRIQLKEEKQFRSQFHEADKERAVLRGKVQDEYFFGSNVRGFSVGRIAVAWYRANFVEPTAIWPHCCFPWSGTAGWRDNFADRYFTKMKLAIKSIKSGRSLRSHARENRLSCVSRIVISVVLQS